MLALAIGKTSFGETVGIVEILTSVKFMRLYFTTPPLKNRWKWGKEEKEKEKDRKKYQERRVINND